MNFSKINLPFVYGRTVEVLIGRVIKYMINGEISQSEAEAMAVKVVHEAVSQKYPISSSSPSSISPSSIIVLIVEAKKPIEVGIGDLGDMQRRLNYQRMQSELMNFHSVQVRGGVDPYILSEDKKEKEKSEEKEKEKDKPLTLLL